MIAGAIIATGGILVIVISTGLNQIAVELHRIGRYLDEHMGDRRE